LQQAINNSVQLTVTAVCRHTVSAGSVRSALLLAAENRSVGQQEGSMVRIFGLVVLALVAFSLGCGPSDTPGMGEDSPELSSSDLLDPTQVPESLRHLVPMATRWGIGDDSERMEFIERSSAADREALARALAPYHADITAWLDSSGAGAMSDEAAAFMYMQLALEEMP
jgi:hypothetical protein